VTLLVDEIIAHMRERVDIPDKKEITLWDRPRPTVPPEQYLPFGETPTGVPPMGFRQGYRYHVTGLYHDARGLPKDSPDIVDALQRRLMRKIEMGLHEIQKYEQLSLALKDARLGIVAYGSSARSPRRPFAWRAPRGFRSGSSGP
jgi:2-oxoglutarate ferredoxin oxidoreductase subunit alpha